MGAEQPLAGGLVEDGRPHPVIAGWAHIRPDLAAFRTEPAILGRPSSFGPGDRVRGWGRPRPADRGRGFDRRHRDRGRREHRKPPAHPGGRPLAGQVGRHRRDQRAPHAHRRTDTGERLDGQRPVVVGAAVGPWQVGEEQVQVRGTADHRREGRRHRVLVAPGVGVVVERVGQRHPFAERRRSSVRCTAVRSSNRTAAPQRRPRSAPPRPRAGERREPGVGQRAAAVQQAQGAEQRVDRLDLADPVATQELCRGCGVARERGRVRDDAARACALRPSTSATRPIRRARAQAARRSQSRRSASDSTIIPTAETRPDASRAAAIAATPSRAALPTVTTAAAAARRRPSSR